MSAPGWCDAYAEHRDQELSTLSCDRQPGHDGDHYDEDYKVSWRHEPEPPPDVK